MTLSIINSGRKTSPVHLSGPVGAERIVSAIEATDAPLALVGGKAANLAVLVRAGIPVPPWFCVTTRVFADLVTATRDRLGALLETLDGSDRRTFKEVSARVTELFLETGLAHADRQALLDRWDASFPRDARVAVRSSAVAEDSAKDSFAGQLDSYLFVERAGLVEHVVRCFASAYSERALLYRKLRGLDGTAADTAVVVQLMVDSRVAGILFTVNPTTGEHEAVVSAGLGQGEGVVGGAVETDTFYCDLATGAVRERVVAEKRSRMIRDPERGTGTRLGPVPEELVSRPTVTDQQLYELVSLGRQIHVLFAGPQDIEWALDPDGTLFILQARAITTLDHERDTIFDNANIIESYPGLSSPLTFSFAREGYTATMREASRRWGVSARMLEAHHAVHENLIGLIDGRIYYNILNWYKLFTMIPGTGALIPAWEKALGLRRRFVRPERRTIRDWLKAAPLVAAVGLRAVWNFLTLQRDVRGYLRLLAETQADFRSHDLASLEAHDLVELLERCSRRLRVPYAVSLVNDTFAQQGYAILGWLIERFRLGDPDGLRNELLCGEQGMESVEPVRSVVRLAATVRQDAVLRALFESDLPPEEILGRVASDPAFGAFHARLRRHLELYGDRVLHELKLETPLAEDDPAFVVTILRNFLHGGQDVEAMEAREQAIRRGAEAKVGALLRFRPLRRLVFRLVLDHCRRTIKNRENLRLARSRAFGVAKRVYRALGRAFVKKGLLGDESDVFFLTTDEVVAVVRGSSVTGDLKGLVALRRRDYATYRGRNPDRRIVTRGIVYANDFERVAPLETGAEPDVLRGIGCSPGQVTGTVKVVLDPQADLDVRGEVLVAPMTDPGWVFLMVAARGIVAERGSILSHTAIIGRELGIPTIVGVKDATRRLLAGMAVELDGQAGTVRILPTPEERAEGDPPAVTPAAQPIARP